MQDLFHSCQSGVQSDDVCAKIAAVGAGVFVAAIELESVVASVATVKLHNAGGICICGEEVACGPGGWRVRVWSADQSVIFEGVGTEALVDFLRRRALGGATGQASARIPYGVISSCHHVVGEDEAIHAGIGILVL